MDKNVDISKLTISQKLKYRKEYPKEHKAYVSALRSKAGTIGGINKGKGNYKLYY